LKNPLNTSTLLVASLTVAGACSVSSADTLTADVWADNWFALYAGDELIKEDSVPYNTERSFNKESFEFDTELPVSLSFIIKDFKENDTGLEYIGSPRVQMGDGGFKAQFFDAATGKLVAASSDEWRCLAIHRAPLNKSCERSKDPLSDCQSDIDAEPDNWKDPEFDDSDWPNAIVHSAQAVRPHGGYPDVDWRAEAKLIWTDDLETDNTVLCRLTIEATN
jgi:hypothetical protein